MRISYLGVIAVPLVLSACSELDLEYTQAGYDEAQGCFNALMVSNAIDRSAGLGIRNHGANQALRAMHEIGPKIGEDATKQRGASETIELVALAKSDPQSAEIIDIEQRAETCAEKYGNPVLK